jgi:hypothetical protein
MRCALENDLRLHSDQGIKFNLAKATRYLWSLRTPLHGKAEKQALSAPRDVIKKMVVRKAICASIREDR